MVDRDRHLERGADAGLKGRDRRPVAPDLDGDGLALVAGVQHAQLDRHGLAHDAEARRLQELDAPVPLAGLAGHQHMDRRMEAERLGLGRDVVHEPVGD